MQQADASRQALEGIFGLIHSGRLDQAEQQCNSLLLQHPQDVNIIGLRGAVLLKMGRLDEAHQARENAINLEPEFAKAHEDQGRLFLIRNEPEAAAQCFSHAIRLDGSQAIAYGGLAKALAQLGKPDEAQAAHQKFLDRSPVARTLIEAEGLLTDGDPAGAERLCQESLRRDPENTQILRMLARIASDDDRAVVAERLLRHIISLQPHEYLPHNELGRFLVEQGRFPEAVEMFEQAIALNESIVDNFRFLGDALAIMGRSGEALAAYQGALQLYPKDPHALAGKGHMLRIGGDKAGAIAAYEKCTGLRPDFGDAWWNLSSLKAYRLSQEQIEAIQQQLQSAEIDVESEIAMHFALARAGEAQGDYDTAWREYSLGNSLKRQQIGYDPVQTEVTHDAIMQQFTRDFLASNTPSTESKAAPIFILGMPRSGSTLLEQILASHSMVEGAGELPYVIMLSASLGRQRADGLHYPELMSELTTAQLESLGQTYLYHCSVHRKLDRPRFTDKMPANFSHVGLIHMMLPDAKIIDARRHPLATCVANYRQLYAQGKNQSYDLVEMAEYYLEYHRIMDHWQNVLPGRVLQVTYEDLVADLDGQTRRMLDYCELPWEDACLDFHRNTRPVNTLSAEQVREPIYSDAVEFWKHYEAQLETIKEILAPVLP